MNRFNSFTVVEFYNGALFAITEQMKRAKMNEHKNLLAPWAENLVLTAQASALFTMPVQGNA